ncbi:hypothetical protein D9758_005826 [Tetrapyrgos nigripes]|uniref:Uncharacterized protein n=1 Tax=Tetrapyrgos nigripes TaxID=182062 RepID=A0A8H5G2X3_9AGAR|nr:hypothetical protein D9758_005826 [Tetrapyrgos nigripes]
MFLPFKLLSILFLSGLLSSATIGVTGRALEQGLGATPTSLQDDTNQRPAAANPADLKFRPDVGMTNQNYERCIICDPEGVVCRPCFDAAPAPTTADSPDDA